MQHSPDFTGAGNMDSALFDFTYPSIRFSLAQQHPTIDEDDGHMPVQYSSPAMRHIQSRTQAIVRHENECSLSQPPETLMNTTLAQHPEPPRCDTHLYALDSSPLLTGHGQINAGRMSFPTQQRAQFCTLQSDRQLLIDQQPSFEDIPSNIMTSQFVNGNVTQRPASRSQTVTAQESSVTTPQSICSTLPSDHIQRNGLQRFRTPASTIDGVDLPQTFRTMTSGQPQSTINQAFGATNNLSDGQNIGSTLFGYTSEYSRQTSRAQPALFEDKSQDGHLSSLSNLPYLDNGISSIGHGTNTLEQSISPLIFTAPLSDTHTGVPESPFAVYGVQQYIKAESPDQLDEQLTQHSSVPLPMQMLGDSPVPFSGQVVQNAFQAYPLYDFNTPPHYRFRYHQSPVPSNEVLASANSASDHGSARGRSMNRNADLDRKLVEWRKAGLTYKEIQRRGNFGLEESTLRGRYRTLTKRKEERVRKPAWPLDAERALLDAVEAEAPASARKPQSKEALDKIPWKRVAQWMVEHRNTYHYGNATVKKKYTELIRKGRGRYRQSSNVGSAVATA